MSVLFHAQGIEIVKERQKNLEIKWFEDEEYNSAKNNSNDNIEHPVL